MYLMSLHNLTLAFNCCGVNPSAYTILSKSNIFNLYLASVNIGEKMAETAYLYQAIVLATCSSQDPIGSLFKRLSNFKCILISLIGFVINSLAINLNVYLHFSFASS